jgi:hypothetical protein
VAGKSATRGAWICNGRERGGQRREIKAAVVGGTRTGTGSAAAFVDLSVATIKFEVKRWNKLQFGIE